MRGRKKGGLSAPAVTIYPPPDSLPACAAAFLEHLAARAYSQGSLDAHHWALKGFLAWAGEQNLTSPAAFTRATLGDYQLHLYHYRSPRTKEPLVVNTQLARLGAIRRFFAWLCRSGAIPANPACDLDLPRKQARHLPKCLDDDEIQRLFALPDTTDLFGLRDRTILELFYATGVRRTEMTRLDHGDFDPSARTLLVRKGKAGKSRLLPVGERAAWWLERYLIESRPIFAHIPSETALFLSGYGTRFSPAYIGNWVAGLMKKAGVKISGSSHLWRHSCATGMLEGGADIRYIQEMLGHEQLTTTQIYTHVSIKALTEVHARCHPYARMPVPSVPNDPPGEPPEQTGTLDHNNAPDEKLSSSLQAADPLSADPAMTAVLSVPEPTLEPPECGGRDPGPDDSDPGFGTFPAPSRPRPPRPRNPRNAMAFRRLRRQESNGIRVRVTDYQYRYYDPLTGRWQSRDPIEEQDGLNLYGSCENNMIGMVDVYGLWGTDVHRDATTKWAKGVGYPRKAAEDIGNADEAVDGGITSPFPITGDQSYHFNRNQNGKDSRLDHFEKHLEEAKQACTSDSKSWLSDLFHDNPLLADTKLGMALHPRQDWVAHGDFGINNRSGVWVWHNQKSPQASLGSEEQRAKTVDNVKYDSDGNYGRPAGAAMRFKNGNDYALFHTGERRYNKTKDLTESALKDFLNHVKAKAKPCGACRSYFLNKNT